MSIRFDLITMGRVGVDLYPTESRVPLSRVRTFARSLGGSPTNVAVAAARLGRTVAVVTKVGADPFGEFIRDALRGFDVDPRFVSTHPTLRTPLAFCELHPPDHFPLLFYREPTAPDLTLQLVDVDFGAIDQARIFWTTGTGLSREPSFSTTMAALERRSQDSAAVTIHDLDYRSTFWDSRDEAGRRQRLALRHATVAVGNREEVAVAVGRDTSPAELVRRLQELGPKVAILKLGPDGVLVADGDQLTAVDPVAVHVVNGLGAGDAFGGALCHGILAGWELTSAVEFANAAGAYVAAELACADAMPREDQVRELLSAANYE